MIFLQRKQTIGSDQKKISGIYLFVIVFSAIHLYAGGALEDIYDVAEEKRVGTPKSETFSAEKDFDEAISDRVIQSSINRTGAFKEKSARRENRRNDIYNKMTYDDQGQLQIGYPGTVDDWIPQVEVRRRELGSSQDLLEAVERGNFMEAVKALSKGASVNASDSLGYSFLHVAVNHKRAAMVELALKNGADVEVASLDGMRPVHQAALVGDIGIYRRLKSAGANIAAKDYRNRSIVHLAGAGGYQKFLSAAVEDGVPLSVFDGNRMTALFYAIFYGQQELAKYILSYNQPYNLQDKFGRTALHLAVVEGTYSIVDDLVKAGVNINISDYKGAPPLLYAVYENNPDLYELLIEEGADEQVVDHFGDNALHIAASKDYLEVFQSALETGVNLGHKDIDGLTPMDFAVLNKDFEFIEAAILACEDIQLIPSMEEGFSIYDVLKKSSWEEVQALISLYDSDEVKKACAENKKRIFRRNYFQHQS